jgi:NADH-quinone oxidoreductase subunit M
MTPSPLFNLLTLPLLGALVVALVPRGWVPVVSLLCSFPPFLGALGLWTTFDLGLPGFQGLVTLSTIFGPVTLGVDGLSLCLVVLTTVLMPLCLLCAWPLLERPTGRLYALSLLVLEALLLGVFLVLDVLVFYLFFEAVLLPMFVIIGVWGSRERRIRAAYQFFLYTLVGSFLMLLAILLLYLQVGSTDFQTLLASTTTLSALRQKMIWLGFFASFAVKVPMVPFHLWLPEAHVEAPTAGSVLLAGVLLKLGTYGFLRWSLPLVPEACVYFTPLVYTLSVVAIVYTSLTTLRQVDLKKIIAYSSVGHMAYVTLGIFSQNLEGVEGALFLMLSHGLVSPALFLCVGMLYDRHRTRLLRYYGGLARPMPVFALVMVFLTMANIGLPGTSSFVGEFLVLTGLFRTNPLMASVAAVGMVLGAAYGLWLCNRLVFGVVKTVHSTTYADVTRRELMVLCPLVVCIVWLGLYPQAVLDTFHGSVVSLLLWARS